MSAAAATQLLDSLPLIRQGKVRDCYAFGDELLFVATTDMGPELEQLLAPHEHPHTS